MQLYKRAELGENQSNVLLEVGPQSKHPLPLPLPDSGYPKSLLT